MKGKNHALKSKILYRNGGNPQMAFEQSYPNMIEEFINTQVISRGRDLRTVKAYQMDLEKFYFWLKEVSQREEDATEKETGVKGNAAIEEGVVAETKRELAAEIHWEEQMESYLKYLSYKKGLRYSTIYRKQKVFSYYLDYLVSQGVLEQYRSLQTISQPQEDSADTLLTKKEVEIFFQAIDQEYKTLDSDFRRRVCLRDQVMMKLLFYHGLEISELLRLEVSDYDRNNAVLTIRRKREKNRTVYLFSRALQAQMAQWLSEHDYFEHEELYSSRMFLSKLGKPLSMKMVINIFDKYRVMAGIEKECKPKDLKNSLGNYAVELVREQG